MLEKKGDAFCSASLPDDYRCGKSLGPVESIQEHPQQPGKILIGYSRGLVILWALSTRQAEQLFLGKQVAVLHLLYQNISLLQLLFNEHFMLFLSSSTWSWSCIYSLSSGSSCSSWRVWYGNVLETCLWVLIMMGVTAYGLLPVETPVVTSHPQPFHTVRKANRTRINFVLSCS